MSFIGIADNIWVDTPGIANTGAAGWVPQSGGVLATMAVDWVTGRAWNNGITTPGTLFTCTRATPVAAYYLNADLTLSTFAANTLRFGSNGLLVEEARTNSALQSNSLSNATWSPNQLTSVTQNVTGPDNIANSAWTLIAAGGGASIINQALALAAGATYSVYAKAGTAPFIFIQTNDAGGNTRSWFNVSTGVVGTTNVQSGSTITHGSFVITALANGWFRISLLTAAAAATTFVIGMSDADNSTACAATHTTFLFGADAEAGAFVTSYIPTTTVAVTRAADLVLSTTANFIGSTSDTVYTQFKLLDISDIRGLFELVGTAGIDSRSQGGTPLIEAIGTGFDATTANSATANVNSKFALAVAVNDLAICLNAGTVAVDATGTMLSAPTSFQVGDVDGVVTKPINGFVLFDAVWKDSRLSNSELQRLTT